MNKTYVTILEDIYIGASTQVHMVLKNTNTARCEAGRPNFPHIIHSNNSEGL